MSHGVGDIIICVADVSVLVRTLEELLGRLGPVEHRPHPPQYTSRAPSRSERIERALQVFCCLQCHAREERRVGGVVLHRFCGGSEENEPTVEELSRQTQTNTRQQSDTNVAHNNTFIHTDTRINTDTQTHTHSPRTLEDGGADGE